MSRGMTNTTNAATYSTSTIARWQAEGDMQAELRDAGKDWGEAEELVWRRPELVTAVVEGRLTAKQAARRCLGRKR